MILGCHDLGQRAMDANAFAKRAGGFRDRMITPLRCQTGSDDMARVGPERRAEKVKVCDGLAAVASTNSITAGTFISL
jgi:hypothetical protein